MGKGSKPRPISIPRKQYEQRWDQVFNIVKGMETAGQSSKDQPVARGEHEGDR